jgi:biopolymer transport protein ExbB
MIALLIVPLPALAQDSVVAIATLPLDLSPWGMYLSADPVVKAVLIGLAFASIVTWTVWLAKTIEIFFAKRRVRAALNELVHARPRRRAWSGWPILGTRSCNSSTPP